MTGGELRAWRLARDGGRGWSVRRAATWAGLTASQTTRSAVRTWQRWEASPRPVPVLLAARVRETVVGLAYPGTETPLPHGWDGKCEGSA